MLCCHVSQSLAAQFPGSEWVTNATATAQYNLRNFDEAQELFEDLLERDPHRIEVCAALCFEFDFHYYRVRTELHNLRSTLPACKLCWMLRMAVLRSAPVSSVNHLSGDIMGATSCFLIHLQEHLRWSSKAV